MKTRFQLYSGLKDERGAVAIIIAISIVMLISFGALAVDLGHLYVVRNELQDAADAGALAGARFLYNEDGTVNEGANQIAYSAAIANTSEGKAVEVNWSGGNGDDVQRGHWSFAARTFTPNSSLDPVVLWGKSTEDLDNDPNFINAVRVKTRRETSPASSFFAKILGYQNFVKSAEAIAYIGFAGTLPPHDVDQPIVICRDSILDENGAYQCSIGRMINSGESISSSETGGWTDFNQEGNPCQGGTNAPAVRSLICSEGNPYTIYLGKVMATNGGEIQSAFNDLIRCWEDTTGKIVPWNLTLPVVTCPGNNVGTCETVVGAVNINILWITGAGEDPDYTNAPTQMEDWSSTDPSGEVRWNSFVTHFNLQNVDGSPAPYAKKSIYFKPDCELHEPTGTTGGENFGVLAKIPVLVK